MNKLIQILMQSKQYYFLLLFILAAVTNLSAQNKGTKKEKRASYSLLKTGDKIIIDGVLDEAIWKKAETTAGFWMSYPEDNKKTGKELQTTVKITYDDNNIYICAICYGDDDYTIKTLKRDNTLRDGDAFGVVIDPVDEQTNGFVFGINPLGVQTEQLVTGQTGRRMNMVIPGFGGMGVNQAWDNKWTSEVTQYPDKWIIEIAIPFKTLRFESDKTKWGINFFRMDAKTNSIHTWSPVPIEFNEIDLGYTGELVWDTPPKKVKSNISVIPYVLGSTFKNTETGDPNENKFNAGIDAKMAITSSLNFDLTINPDFSQVETDEQITNLTLFSIMLPEKRLFFLDNKDIFEDFGTMGMQPFFSRKIGLDDYGNPIPILYGARVTGNINKDLRIGLMNMQTRKTDDFLAQNYTAFAFHHRVFARSVVKGFIHNRTAFDSPEDDYNRNIGLTFSYFSQDGRTNIYSEYSKSFSPGITDEDYFFNGGFNYGNRNFNIMASLSGFGINYRADMGFFNNKLFDAENFVLVPIGKKSSMSSIGYTFYADDNPKIISQSLSIMNIMDMMSDFDLISRNTTLSYSLNLANTSGVSASFTNNRAVLHYAFSFTDLTKYDPLPAGTYDYSSARISYTSDQRKLFSFNGGLMYGGFYNGTRSQIQFGVKYRVQPWGNFAVKVEHNNLEFPDNYGKEKLWMITPRIDINFSKSLFWTTFMQYNTQGDNFNINSRIQWRFKPMSDIYFVYTDNYFVNNWGQKNRAFVIKMNYWLNL